MADNGPAIRVKINHTGNNTSSLYWHLASYSVKKGDHVTRGDVIGTVGNTGVSSGTHLHFEFRQRGVPVDPAKYFKIDTKKPYVDDIESPAPTENAAQPAAAGETMAERLKTIGRGERFDDYRYLTPEEELIGIVPFFDYNTIRAHAFIRSIGSDAASDAHYQSMLNSEFLWRRYQTRSMGAISMPFNPYPIQGFPAVVLDRVRSVVGLMTSITHSISLSGGGGSAMSRAPSEAPGVCA